MGKLDGVKARIVAMVNEFMSPDEVALLHDIRDRQLMAAELESERPDARLDPTLNLDGKPKKQKRAKKKAVRK